MELNSLLKLRREEGCPPCLSSMAAWDCDGECWAVSPLLCPQLVVVSAIAVQASAVE